MRRSTAILIGLAVVLQYPLWLGKGGWLKVWDSDRQLSQQRDTNRQLELRNAGLDAETRNLKSGLDAVEERSRYELGMIKGDEVFYQLPQRAIRPDGSAPAAAQQIAPPTGGAPVSPPSTATRADQSSPKTVPATPTKETP